MNLHEIAVVEITPSTPFNFDSTFHKPDHFASQDHEWQPGVRWQTANWQGQQLGLKLENIGVVDKPKIRLSVYAAEGSSVDIEGLATEIRYRYNLDLNLMPFYKQFKDDQVLSPIISRWQGMRPSHSGNLYEYLIIGIVLQNTTVRRSIQMLQTMFEHYGTLVEFDGKKFWCFWEPGGLQDVTEEDLRSLKVGYRAKSIKRIDEHFRQKLIDEITLRGKDMATQKQELLDIYGVGPATVWYLLFDVFHHWNFFDHISPWEQKIYSKLFFDQDPDNPVPVEKLIQRFEAFMPYQQLAVHYIWEDLWWKRKNESVGWLEELIRV